MIDSKKSYIFYDQKTRHFVVLLNWPANNMPSIQCPVETIKIILIAY